MNKDFYRSEYYFVFSVILCIRTSWCFLVPKELGLYTPIYRINSCIKVENCYQNARFLFKDNYIADDISQSFLDDDDNYSFQKFDEHSIDKNMHPIPSTTSIMNWNTMYYLLLSYGEDHNGNCDVDRSCQVTIANVDGTSIFRLGVWLGTQKRLRKFGQLEASRYDKLQQLVDAGKLSWHLTADDEEKEWNNYYRSIIKYMKEHNGDRDIPLDYNITLNGVLALNLGKWLCDQNLAKQQGELTEERSLKIQKLEEISQDIKRMLAKELQGEKSFPEGRKPLFWLSKKNTRITEPFEVDDISRRVNEISAQKMFKNQNSRQIFELITTTVSSLQKGVLTTITTKAPIHQKLDRDSQWNNTWKLLLKYGDENDGDCNVPFNHVVSLANGRTVRLGEWLHLQRKLYRKNSLLPERAHLLNQLVEERKLIWEKYNSAWNTAYSLLLDYAREHRGNCNVPKAYEVVREDNTTFQLGEWVSRQRQQYHTGSLSEDRYMKLQELVEEGSFAWVVDSSATHTNNHQWNVMYELLVAVLEGSNHSIGIPVDFKAVAADGRERRLGVWLSQQRNSYWSGELEASRREKLEQLVRTNKLNLDHQDAAWNNAFALLLQYGRVNRGDCNPTTRCKVVMGVDGSTGKEKTFNLGPWLSTQRSLYRAGTLDPTRQAKLQALVDSGNMSWEPLNHDDDIWYNAYSHVLAFGEKCNGDCNVPYKYIISDTSGKDIRLGEWLARQKKLYRNGNLKPDRKVKLQELIDSNKINMKF